jgi:hypothetical protein
MRGNPMVLAIVVMMAVGTTNSVAQPDCRECRNIDLTVGCTFEETGLSMVKHDDDASGDEYKIPSPHTELTCGSCFDNHGSTTLCDDNLAAANEAQAVKAELAKGGDIDITKLVYARYHREAGKLTFLGCGDEVVAVVALGMDRVVEVTTE